MNVTLWGFYHLRRVKNVEVLKRDVSPTCLVSFSICEALSPLGPFLVIFGHLLFLIGT